MADHCTTASTLKSPVTLLALLSLAQFVHLANFLLDTTVEVFNVDSKAECGQRNIAYVARNKKV